MAEPLAFDIIARDRASQTTRKVGREFQGLKSSTVGAFAGMGAAVGTFAIGALGSAARAVKDFVVDSVRQFSDFDRSMREVWTLLPDLSKSAFTDLQGDVRDFAVEMGVATTETVPALYQAISAGVPQENVFDFLTTAAKFSIGGVTSLETAVDGLTSVTNAYGTELLSAQEASDIFFTTVRLGKTDASQLSSSLFQVIPTAAALGVEFETVGAALATITAQGVPTSVATTQLRQLLVELNKEGGKTADLFNDLSGKSFADFINQGGTVEEALALMKEAAEDNNISLDNLFGSVEAGNAALALTSEEGAEKFKDALGEMEESSGATDEAFQRMDEGMGRSWDKILVRFDEFKLAVGEKLAPAIESILDKFDELTDGTTEQGENFQELADTAQEQVDTKINPALERFRESMGKTGSENQGFVLAAIKAFGSLAAFWVNNWRIMGEAAVKWKDIVVESWKRIINFVVDGADVMLTAAIKAFGWVPGLGPKLRGARNRLRDFKDDTNRILNNIKSRVNINVHTNFTESGRRPPQGGGAYAAQHGGWVPGPFTGIDRVPALLTTDEFVVSRGPARRHARLLEAINSGEVSRMTMRAPAAVGGVATVARSAPAPVVLRIQTGGTELDRAIVEIIRRGLRENPGFRSDVVEAVN